MDMIYNTEEKFSVDLSKMPKLQREHIEEKQIIEKELLETGGLIRNLAADARKARAARHQNQLRLIIQKRIKKLNNEFIKNDFAGKGAVNKVQFFDILKGLEVNEQIMTEKDLETMFGKH